jgi:hypothetical protein
VTSTPETLLAITEGIALDFLHSVVLIDDRVFLGPLPSEALPVADVPAEVITPSRRGAAPVETEPAVFLPTEASFAPADHHLDARPLLDGFAEKGLVFAPLRLDKDENEPRTVKAAQRADIVVLDWKINGNYGDMTIRLIRDILAAAGDPQRLRLIAIYTGENTLADITKRVRSALEEIFPDEAKAPDEPFAVRRGPVRVVVYAKEGTKLPEEDAELHGRISTAEDLPARLLTDFARLTSGLVSNVGLEALARLRGNMHRILRRLHPGLDAAYLSHRALVTPPEEAEDHLIAVVVSEIATVLEENAVGKHANLNAIRAWLNDRIAAGVDFKGAFELGALDPVESLCQLLEVGVDDKALPPEMKALADKKQARALTERFCKPDNDVAERDTEFARLLSMRARYGTRKPFLTLGTVVAKGAGATLSYWLCVQPVCDAVRISNDRKFPLVPLRAVKEQEGFDLVLIENSKIVRLKASTHPYHQDAPSFKPDASRMVRPTVKEDGTMLFTTTDGAEYRWVGELKPDYAQRLLQQIGAQQSRIGVVESEWMRRSRDQRSKPGE